LGLVTRVLRDWNHYRRN